MSTTARAVVAELRARADPSRKPGMARVGITVDRALGVSIPDLRRIARAHRGDHGLALELWATGIHEARILASMVDDPEQVSRAQMDAWVADFDSWDLCDQVCNNLFRAVAGVDQAARAWARARDAYVKRAAFTIVAVAYIPGRIVPSGLGQSTSVRSELLAGSSAQPVRVTGQVNSWPGSA